MFILQILSAINLSILKDENARGIVCNILKEVVWIGGKMTEKKE